MAPPPPQQSRDRLVPVWLGGQAPAIAVLTGGVAFGGTLTLAAVIINLLYRG